MKINDLIDQIDEALPRASDSSARVLTYVRSQITPEGRDARPEEYEDVSHLTEVAELRLRAIPAPKEDPDEA